MARKPEAVVVIGAGIAGMSAALAVADAGYPAVLVEREEEPGGNARRLHFTLGGADPQALLRRLVERVREHPLVTLHCGSTVRAIEGYVGNFRSTLVTADGGQTTVEHGAVIVATGAAEYSGNDYLLGEHPRVVTQTALERHPADMLVLSVGVVPHDNRELASMLKVPLGRHGFFLEAHMKLRPVDFATDGVFLCGLAHWPKHVDEAIAQAQAAASRALTPLSRTAVLAEGMVARVDEDRCVACGTCEHVCAYGAVAVNPEKAAVNQALCKGCGACAAACRCRAIEIGGWPTRRYSRHWRPCSHERVGAAHPGVPV